MLFRTLISFVLVFNIIVLFMNWVIMSWQSGQELVHELPSAWACRLEKERKAVYALRAPLWEALLWREEESDAEQLYIEIA